MDANILAILACPICKGRLVYNDIQQTLICKFDRLAFPIDEGIPILLESQAKPLEGEENDGV